MTKQILEQDGYKFIIFLPTHQNFNRFTINA